MSNSSRELTCPYEIVSVEMQSDFEDIYIITWNVTMENSLYREEKAYITYKYSENGEDEYELTSSIFYNTQRYNYKGNIDIEQPKINIE